MSPSRQCDNCPQKKSWVCVGDFPVEQLTKEEVIEDILLALKNLYAKDFDLIQRRVNERCISARFYAYFERLHQKKYKRLNIDPEYNKNGMMSKVFGELKQKKKSAIPDMIVHKRNCNKHNIVYMELKPIGKNKEHDFNKIKIFTSEQDLIFVNCVWVTYAYQHGVSIAFGKEIVEITYFSDGTERYSEKYNPRIWERM